MRNKLKILKIFMTSRFRDLPSKTSPETPRMWTFPHENH